MGGGDYNLAKITQNTLGQSDHSQGVGGGEACSQLFCCELVHFVVDIKGELSYMVWIIMSLYGVIGYHVTLSKGHMIANHPI